MSSRKAAIEIIRRLCENGFEALLAGGCVRDMLLGRRANDYDVATTARPEQVTALFKRTLQVGAKFGVVIVMMDNEQVEVATFRTESGYADGRHPQNVEFAHAKEDADRRDFTINGMFFDPIENRVIDYVQGQRDLEKRIIRTIGPADERFGEDYLRMLRAVRFSAQLGFEIEPATWAAIAENAGKIKKISGERISTELEGILCNPNRRQGASMLVESGLAGGIFPGISDDLIEEGICALGHLRKNVDFALALAAFFVGFEADFALEKCEIIKPSRNQMKEIAFLLENRGRLLDPELSLAQLKLLLAKPYFWNLFELQRAIQKSLPSERSRMSALIKLRRRIRDLRGVDVKPKPLLNGHDLMKLGAPAGPALGQLAEEMYIAQLEGILKNCHDAEQWTLKWIDKHKQNEGNF